MGRLDDDCRTPERPIDNLRGVHDLANETIIGWDIRIAEIDDAMHLPDSDGHRDKRGLFDAFGDLSKAMFGTATDADVQEVRDQLRTFGATNSRVVHYVSKLITVVNHTHDQLSENRRHIVTLHKYCNQLSRAIRITATAMNSTKQRLTVLQAKLRIGQILSGMEASHESAVNADEVEETEFRDWKFFRRIAAIYVHHVRKHFGKKCKLLPQPSVVVHPKTTQQTNTPKRCFTQQ